MIYQDTFTFTSQGRGTYDITAQVRAVVGKAEIETGLCHLFVHHTSASIILCENADPTVRRDLETFMARVAPDGDPDWLHVDEGPDDMPAHIRTILTKTDLTIPISRGECALGTWQGIYLWEHRSRGHRREITVTVYA